MPQNITDVDAFTEPLTAPAGADARTAASILAALQKVANRTRHLYALISPRIVADEWTYPTPKAWEYLVPLAARAPSSWIFDSTNIALQSTADAARVEFAMKFPAGITITDYEVLVTCGAARTSGSRILTVLRKRSGMSWSGTLSAGTLSLIASANDPGSVTGLQLCSPSSFSELTTASAIYSMEVLSGNDGGSHVADKIWGIRLLGTTPGPRPP